MSLNVDEIRRDFPILNRVINGKRLIYFDNTATSQKPIQVINAIRDFYLNNNANIHRGLHTLSQEASEMYEEAHDVVARFIGAKGREELIFVRNASEALNLSAMILSSELKAEDEIIVTIMEHHSNLLPWIFLARRTNARVRIISIKNDYTLDYDALERTISEKTRIVAITHMSNVLGTINDIKLISKMTHDYDAYVVIDGAQSVPHIPVNVKDLDADFLAFSGHKMLGPTGIGALYCREDILDRADPFLLGGDMIKSVSCKITGECNIIWNDLPWKYEAGTPNIAGGIGFAEAVRYLERIGMKNVKRHEEELLRYALKRIDEELSGVIDIYGPSDPRKKGGIISFNIKNHDPHTVAIHLDSEGIAIRSGFHCAQPLHEYLGLMNGSARASFYIYNTKDEIDVFIEALKKLVSED